MKKAMALLSPLLLVGAGCFSASTDTEINVGKPPENPTPSAEVEVEVGTQATADADTELDITLSETVDMQSGNFYFKPDEISAAPGQTVNVRVTSTEGTHTFVIDGVTKQTVSANGTITFTAPSVPGEYPFYCDIGSHRAYGMKGTLFVE